MINGDLTVVCLARETVISGTVVVDGYAENFPGAVVDDKIGDDPVTYILNGEVADLTVSSDYQVSYK